MLGLDFHYLLIPIYQVIKFNHVLFVHRRDEDHQFHPGGVGGGRGVWLGWDVISYVCADILYLSKGLLIFQTYSLCVQVVH